MKPLRLLNRQPKPQRHLGVMRSDDVLQPYLRQLEEMPRKYRVDPRERVPLLRRWLRWLRSIW